jgi:hypothetical protein
MQNNYQGQQNGGYQNNNQTKIFRRSFSGSNLIDITLIRDDDPELPWYKSKHFVFLGFKQGVQNPQGGRTFASKKLNNGIIENFKIDLEKLLALGTNLEMLGKWMGPIPEKKDDPTFWARTIGKFSVISDSSKSKYGSNQKMFKQIFVSTFMGKDGQNNPERKVSLNFKFNETLIPTNMTPMDAIALGEILKFIAMYGIEKEKEVPINDIGTVQDAPNNNGYQQQQPNNQGYQQQPTGQQGGYQQQPNNQGYQQPNNQAAGFQQNVSNGFGGFPANLPFEG